MDTLDLLKKTPWLAEFSFLEARLSKNISRVCDNLFHPAAHRDTPVVTALTLRPN